MKTYQAFLRGPVYSDLNIGEKATLRNKKGEWRTVELVETGYQGAAGKPGCAELGWISVKVEGLKIDIPLGWWRTVNGVRVIAEIHAGYNSDEERKSLEEKFWRLEHDARICMSDALNPLVPKGRCTLPLGKEDWSWTPQSNWLTKYDGGTLTHAGVDLNCPVGAAPARAAIGGEVVFVGGYKKIDEIGGPGRVVSILGDDGIGYLYAHMDDLAEGICEGARIEQGEEMGPSGRAGFENVQTAAHLHFEMVIGEAPEAIVKALRPPFFNTGTEKKAFRINPFPYLYQWYEELRGREQKG